MGWGYGNGYMTSGWGFGLLGGIISLIFWVVIIIAIVWAVRLIVHGGEFHHGPHGSHMSGEDSAMKILKERYAKGEINKEEFETKKKDLLAK